MKERTALDIAWHNLQVNERKILQEYNQLESTMVAMSHEEVKQRAKALVEKLHTYALEFTTNQAAMAERGYVHCVSQLQMGDQFICEEWGRVFGMYLEPMSSSQYFSGIGEYARVLETEVEKATRSEERRKVHRIFNGLSGRWLADEDKQTAQSARRLRLALGTA